MNNSAYNLTQYDKIMKFTNLSDYDGVFSPFTQAWIPAWGGWAMELVLNKRSITVDPCVGRMGLGDGDCAYHGCGIHQI